MRFLVDECTGPSVARYLREIGHTVFSVYEQARGLKDAEIMLKAFQEDWIVITNDKDFGEKVYRENYPHKGVILLRLEDERSDNKITVLKTFLAHYQDKLADNFVVITEDQVRFAKSIAQ